MIRFFCCLLFLSFGTLGQAQFEGNQTPEYPALVQFYKDLASRKKVELYAMGSSDYGLPIYLCILNGSGDSTATFAKARSSSTLFINNGIHPGEPDGINACGMLTQQYVSGALRLPQNVLVAFILCYNVGGAMHRGSYSRANQLGPEEYGFRGNAQNLDLNRDFIKMDSKNAFTFVNTFQALDPDLFLDTHVSNGADYQHVLTLIYPARQRLAPAMQKICYDNFIPKLESQLRVEGIDVVPYVETIKETPDDGITAFNDLPRYASGFTGLFHCLSITTETHMLKGFELRVEATKKYLVSCINWLGVNARQLETARTNAKEEERYDEWYRFHYQLTELKDSIRFKGFEHAYKKSEVSGLDRLYYDRSKPFDKMIPYQNQFKATDSVKIPKYYVVQGQCAEVLRRLKANGVQMTRVEKDQVSIGYFLKVKHFTNGVKPYEGHYLHRETVVDEVADSLRLREGDFLIATDQDMRRFICSVLEPEAEDSYFAWNFFDSYVQEKEYFSAYVFEDVAAELLRNNPALRQELEAEKLKNSDMAKSAWDQLYFVYQRSPYFEDSFMKLPIFKLY